MYLCNTESRSGALRTDRASDYLVGDDLLRKRERMLDSSTDLDGLVAAFEARTLPLAAFGHREHIAVAWAYLGRATFGAAGDRFCENLRGFANAHGKASVFHATISWAYLALVHARMRDETSFAAFAAANPDLLDHPRGALRRVYDDATLDSELARARFVLPRAT